MRWPTAEKGQDRQGSLKVWKFCDWAANIGKYCRQEITLDIFMNNENYTNSVGDIRGQT